MAANDESKGPANLKVPPLKIVLSAGSNLVASVDEEQQQQQLQQQHPKGSGLFKGDKSADQEHSSSSSTSTTSSSSSSGSSSSAGRHRNGAANSETGADKHHKRSAKAAAANNNDSLEEPAGGGACRPTRFLSTSSSSAASDRSNSTTPSSESESLASNSTIISEHQHQVRAKTDSTPLASANKEEPAGGRSSARHAAASHKGGAADKSSAAAAAHKRLHELDQHQQEQHQQTPGNSSSAAAARDQTSNANQRITRSSQRAAQQTKASETSVDASGADEQPANESQEKIPDSSRKVKRRKGELQEAEHDAQAAAQTAPTMANICPADYLLPSQNSFELYRDIRKQPYKKLMKLSHIQPKVPLGFKDYLINGGPYLLEGNKLGTGLGGHRLDNLTPNGSARRSRIPLKTRPSSNHKNSFLSALLKRHNLYDIPKPLEPPRALPLGTPLYDLFQEQEKARQQMRMQHLKERERAILAAEQEILRAYNNAAIANVRQKRHLSACTFFYYQERYHYLEEKNDSTLVNSSMNSRPVGDDNSFLINDSQDGEGKQVDSSAKNSNSPQVGPDTQSTATTTKHEKKNGPSAGDNSASDKAFGKAQSDKNDAMDTTQEDSVSNKETSLDTTTNGSKKNSSEEASEETTSQRKTSKDVESGVKIDGVPPESKTNQQSNTTEPGTGEGAPKSPLKQDGSDGNKNMSDQDLKLLNKEVFITQLHEIDDKWDYIKRDMMVRHKNEADSLNAVQSLDWEWKAKETGVCDVRVTLKVEPEFVPKVEVEAQNY